METLIATIPARSRRQAMDWSLVLVSQGIESIIERGEDQPGWQLRVSPSQYDSALEAIHRYQIENRRWPWQQKVLQPGLLFDWASLAWTTLLIFFYFISNAPDLKTAGLMVSGCPGVSAWPM